MSFGTVLNVLVAVIAVTTTAMAHESHTSVSEVEWNPTSQRFEVAMRLHIVDLEDSVSVVTGKKFRLEGNKAVPEQLTAYLSKRFAIRSLDGQQTKLHWVGMELQLHDAWVYFELEVLPASSAVDQDKPNRVVENWDQLFEDHTSAAKRTAVAKTSALKISDAKQLKIESSVLFEAQPEQKNIVTVTVSGNTNSVVLVPGKRADVLDVVTKRKWQIGPEQQG